MVPSDAGQLRVWCWCGVAGGSPLSLAVVVGNSVGSGSRCQCFQNQACVPQAQSEVPSRYACAAGCAVAVRRPSTRRGIVAQTKTRATGKQPTSSRRWRMRTRSSVTRRSAACTTWRARRDSSVLSRRPTALLAPSVRAACSPTRVLRPVPSVLTCGWAPDMFFGGGRGRQRGPDAQVEIVRTCLKSQANSRD